MKNCRITVTKATVDEVLGHFLRLGMCSFDGIPGFSSHPFQVRCIDNRVGWSSKKFYDSDPTFSRLPKITLGELRALKSLKIKREVSKGGRGDYKLNGLDVWISDSDNEVEVRNGAGYYWSTHEIDGVNFVRKFLAANPGELVISTDNKNIMNFLRATNCI